MVHLSVQESIIISRVLGVALVLQKRVLRRLGHLPRQPSRQAQPEAAGLGAAGLGASQMLPPLPSCLPGCSLGCGQVSTPAPQLMHLRRLALAFNLYQEEMKLCGLLVFLLHSIQVFISGLFKSIEKPI